MAEKAINKTKAILFDLDGTLAQTMEFHYDAWRRAMLHYGIDLVPEDYYPLEGTNLYELAKKLPLQTKIFQKRKKATFNHTTLLPSDVAFF